MKLLFDNAIEAIEEGRKEKRMYIPVHLKAMSKHVHLAQRRYHLIGADTNTGKTKFVDETYVLQPYNWLKENRDKTDLKLRVFLRSMERSKKDRMMSWISYYLYNKYGYRYAPEYLSGMSGYQYRVSDELLSKIKEARSYFEELEDSVTIIDGATNPTGIYKQVEAYMLANGTREQVNEYESVYTPNDPNELVVVIEDHIGRARHEMGLDDKGTVDKLSYFNTVLRDHFGCMIVAVSQMNRAKGDPTRRTRINLAPERGDFKGTGNTAEDADVILALFSPSDYQIDGEYMEYPMERFKTRERYNRFRSVHLIKNTYGPAGTAGGYLFVGEVGAFHELPPAERMSDLDANGVSAWDKVAAFAEPFALE